MRFRSCFIIAGLGLPFALSAPGQAQTDCGEGWVQVGEECRLPEDLQVGDFIQITIGSAVHSRAAIIGYADCGGHRTYFTSPYQGACGWRDGVTAYARNTGDIDIEIETESALELP